MIAESSGNTICEGTLFTNLIVYEMIYLNSPITLQSEKYSRILLSKTDQSVITKLINLDSILAEYELGIGIDIIETTLIVY